MSATMTTRAVIIIISTLAITTTSVTTIANYGLMASITSIPGVLNTMVIKVTVWPWAFANHFITAIQIVAAIS
jgi:hypothetical protein